MHIDICIPVCKPDEKLIRLLEGLKRQTCRVNKLIIMYTRLSESDRISDDYISLAREAANELVVHDLDVREFDHGATRARGAEYSNADIIIYMTQDAVPYDELLIENLIKPFESEMVASAYARQMPAKDSTLAECFTRGFNYPDASVVKSKADLDTMGIKAFFCSNVCAAYRMGVYRELGGFVKRTIFNEDMIYAHAVLMHDYSIAYCAEARVIHTHNYSAMQQLHRNFDLAVSQAMYNEVFDGISSESEGKKYIKEAYRYFRDKHRGYLIIPFIYGCCFKYLGYLLGKRYRRLPMWMINACAMNKGFFREEKNVRTE